MIGRRFRYDLFEALGELEPDVLLDSVDDAQRAHLIVADEGRSEAWFSFGHELIRQTLLTGLSLPRRQRMHLRIAEALDQLYGAAIEERAADMAHHLYQAGAAADAKKTCRYLQLAGDQALGVAAFEDALGQYEHALSLQLADDGARADLMYKRGSTLQRLGRWEEATADWRDALIAYEQVGDAESVGRISGEIALQLGRPLW